MSKKLSLCLVVILLAASMAVPALNVAAMPPLTFSSNIRVQNIEGEDANVVISFYDLDGDGTPVDQLFDTIEGYGDRFYFTVSQLDLGDDWSGSAVVGADREIRVVNNLFTEDEMFQGSSDGFLEGAYEVGLPLIQLNNSGYDTWFNVQNVGPDEATVTVEFQANLAGKDYTTAEITLQPFTAHTFDQRDMETELGGPSAWGVDTFIGSATVKSEGSPVVATVVQGNDSRLLVYDGFVTSGTEGILVAPLYHTNHNTLIGSIHVQNRGDTTTDVTVQYVPSTSVGMGTACYETHTIEPGDMQIFGLFAFNSVYTTYAPDSNCYTLNGMNAFVGSAYIDQSSGNSTGQPLVVEVQQLTNSDNTASANNAAGPEAAAPYLACPEILDRNNGYWTSINMFNASQTDSEDITIEYHGYDQNGVGNLVTKTQTLTLGPLESTNILHAYAPSSPYAYALADGFVGSAIIKADDGEAELVAVVNKLGAGSGDVLSTYNAFPLETLP